VVAASIRTNNPGAMWGGKRADKWGATHAEMLNDGLGQGNNIAVFPTKVQGAAAQFDLWRAGYTGMSLATAIKRWSGGNSNEAYLKFLQSQTGIGAVDMITEALLASPQGLALMKAQARWEAGGPYPMTDAEWQRAQNLIFPGSIPPPPDIPSPVPQPHQPIAPTGLWATFKSIFIRKV